MELELLKKDIVRIVNGIACYELLDLVYKLLIHGS